MNAPTPDPLTKEQKQTATNKLRDYLYENFDTEIGNMQSDFFLDYISENIGAYYYNKGIADAMAFIADKTEDMYLLMKDE
ncbi:MAG: DUF2164 domain-containing protein [Defluviitaleaceae bacterium]|nr:DUF2164 domain-containing protein [Defluviitaleaceae bacterium]